MKLKHLAIFALTDFRHRATKLTGQPKDMASVGDRRFVATSKSVDIFVKDTLIDTVPMMDVTATASM